MIKADWWSSPVQVQGPGQQRPVLAGVGAVEGGADALADGGGDAEDPGARLGGDGAVGPHQEGDQVLVSLQGHTRPPGGHD